MSKRWRAVLEFLRDSNRNTRELAEHLDMSMNSTYSLLRRMKKRHFIREIDREDIPDAHELVVWEITRSGRRHLPQEKATA